MKQIKKILFATLIVAMTLVMGFSAMAATKKGLVKKGKNFYFYKNNGKMLVNKWKTIREKGKKYKFYFGKNGKAYKADMPFDKTYVVKVKKIDGTQYGFDTAAHMVKGGPYVDQKGRLWVFKKDGQYDAETTKALRNAVSFGEVGTDLKERIIAAFGEPVKEETYDSCDKWNGTEEDKFTDILMYYSYFQIQLVKNEKTGEYKMNGFVPIEVS